MTRNLVSDPVVLLGFAGYSLRCEAHRLRNGTFVSSLQVKEGDLQDGDTLFDSTFEMPFANPDAAINWAMLRGRQIVGRLLEVQEKDTKRKRA